MTAGVALAEKILAYLKKIYPNHATKKEIFSEVRIAGCSGDTWLKTLVVNREIEVIGKKGRYNIYRFKKQ